jgi:hypothetical protein
MTEWRQISSNVTQRLIPTTLVLYHPFSSDVRVKSHIQESRRQGFFLLAVLGCLNSGPVLARQGFCHWVTSPALSTGILIWVCGPVEAHGEAKIIHEKHAFFWKVTLLTCQILRAQKPKPNFHFYYNKESLEVHLQDEYPGPDVATYRCSFVQIVWLIWIFVLSDLHIPTLQKYM